MKQFTSRSDEFILSELGDRISQTRLNANISQKLLAKEAGISQRTMTRIESGESVQFINIIRVLRALNMVNNLNVFIPKVPESPLQKLKLKKQRQRASKHDKGQQQEAVWTWGDDS